MVGAIIGEFLKIEGALEKLGGSIKNKLHAKEARFTEGLVTAFLLFCIGPMTILGTINEGLREDKSLILTKSLLDGITSIIFATTFGIGVLFSAIPLFIFQSVLTIAASTFQTFFNPEMINQFTSVGGILLIGIGINLLNIKHIKVANLLPALLVVLILSAIF